MIRMKPYTATLVITPLINADTWLGAAGCASGSQTCNGTSPAFEPAPISARTKTQGRDRGVRMPGAHWLEGIAARGAGQQTEGQQQGQAAERRHDQVDEAGARAAMAGVALMRHDQRPRGQRHQFPAEQKQKGVIGDNDERNCRPGRRDRTAGRARDALRDGRSPAQKDWRPRRPGRPEPGKSRPSASRRKWVPTQGRPNGRARCSTGPVSAARPANSSAEHDIRLPPYTSRRPPAKRAVITPTTDSANSARMTHAISLIMGPGSGMPVRSAGHRARRWRWPRRR